MAHFLAMGGYAAFIWPAYGATVIGIGGIVWATLRDYARAKRRLAQLESDERL
jgi:heme exporter protein D